MMGHIFLSYAGSDRERVQPLVRALQAPGWSVWWDRTIRPGRKWDEVVEEALDSAACVVVVWSRDSVKSEWVRAEAAEGLRRGILVPVLIDDVMMPLEFRRVQVARLLDWSPGSPHEEFEGLLGAVDALLRPPAPRAVTEPGRAEAEARERAEAEAPEGVRHPAAAMLPLPEMVGESPGVVAVRETIGRLLRQAGSRRLPPVLIEGETGTGKGLLARLLHRAGPRSDGPFVHVNCAAIPDTLVEAELFGFERGAFTDARQAKPGLFQAAHGGILFLDEVALLPEELQGKLLTALEERTVRRLGSTRGEPVDVAIVAATGEDLEAAMRERRFHEALYHRLSVVVLRLPPLRERGSDILVLAEFFLTRACTDYKLRQKTLTADARTALLAYRWPGNVRELNNLMERVALLSETSHMTGEMLGLPESTAAARAPAQTKGPGPLRGAAGRLERETLLAALSRSGGNITHAATDLGMPPNTLRYHLKKHGLLAGMSPRVQRAAPEPVPSVPASAPIPPIPAPRAPRWERRCLATLRAEVVSLPADEAPADASPAMTVLLEKVRTFGGRVEEVGPTGMVAAFGLEPVEDAPRRAAHAAMTIQNAVERVRSGGVESLGVKIAIHVIHCLVGHTGDKLSIDLDGKRQAWSVLDALVVRGEPGTILVSGEAAPFLERRFDLLPRGAGETSEPMYRLAGGEQAGFRARGGVTTFVGREHELQLLGNRLTLVTQGHGQVVGIAGEAGIGKSRLLFEFREQVGAGRATYLEGRCLSYATGIPYFPLIEILRDLCEILETESSDSVSAKVRRRLDEAGMDPEDRAPYLLQLLGATEGSRPTAVPAPEVIKTRTFETLRQMILAASRRRPTVVAVEDLHSIDQTSEEFLSSLVASLPSASVLLLLTYRPGYRPRWIERSYATQIALPALSPTDSLAVIRSTLVTEAVPDPLTKLILDRAEGNPFFLEELARIVTGQTGFEKRPAIPETVQGVLIVRIDQLSPDERRVLQCASVIGKDIPFAILRRLVELPDDELRSALANLEAAELLHEKSSAHDLALTFKHALTHEVAYESLAPERRQALHARVLETLETIHVERLGEQLERLAHHAIKGQVWDKARAYLRQAGAKAAARSSYREAVTYFEQALEALRHLPETRDTVEEGIDLRLDLRNALLPLAEYEPILDHLRQAESLANTLGDRRRLGHIASHMAHYFWSVGDNNQAIESAQRALASAAPEDFAVKVHASFCLGEAYYALGDHRRAIDVLTTTVESVQGDLLWELFGQHALLSVRSRRWLVQSLAEVGEFAEGVTHGQEAIRIAEAADHPHSLVNAYYGIAHLYLREGRFDAAIPVLERSAKLCQAWGLPLMIPAVASLLGYAYALSGRSAEALSVLGEAASTNIRTRDSVYVWLGDAYLLAGQTGEARVLGHRALELSRAHNERGTQAWTSRLLGELASHRDSSDVAAAEDLYHRAATLAVELGMRPLVAHCRLGLGDLYCRVGRPVQACEQLSEAIELFRAMQMTFWLRRAEAARSSAQRP